MKYKIATEVAEQEFQRLCESNRVDTDTNEMDQDSLSDWLKLKQGVIRDLRLGTLVVGEDGKPTYTPEGSSKGFTFHAPTGATLLAGETYKGDRAVSNTYVALADLTRSDRGEFSKLHTIDVKACMRIMQLFLAQG